MDDHGWARIPEISSVASKPETGNPRVQGHATGAINAPIESFVFAQSKTKQMSPDLIVKKTHRKELTNTGDHWGAGQCNHPNKLQNKTPEQMDYSTDSTFTTASGFYTCPFSGGYPWFPHFRGVVLNFGI